MEATADVLSQRLIAILFAASFGLIASRVAWKRGYYYLPPEGPVVKGIPHWKNVLQAFTIFLGMEIVLAPMLYALWLYWDQGSIANLETFDFSPELKGIVNLVMIGLTFVILLLFFNSLNKPTREAVWGSPSEIRSVGQNIRDFLTGSVTWIIAYPWIIVVSQLLAIMLALLFSGPSIDQAAVKHLKEMFSHPAIFAVTAIAVATIIPFIEELLFRGFLQSWLKTTFGRGKAILLTSLIFASFHFTVSQGVENIEFISSLFLLSCYLGFLKERQQSLWAPIGLHATFNAISILMLMAEV